MFHRLVREIVLEHRSLSFPRQAAFSLQKFTKKTAAWIPLTYSAYNPSWVIVLRAMSSCQLHVNLSWSYDQN